MIDISYLAFLNHSGYGQAAKDMILAMHKSGLYNVRVDALCPAPKPSSSDEEYSIFKNLTSKPKNNNAIQIFHCIPDMQRRRQRMRKNIGLATFETYDPPENWIKILNTDDAVIAPSKFNYSVFAHSGVKCPLFHIPHCIDINKFNTMVEPMKKYDKFTFLFFGAWKIRKGYEQLIEAWFREFTNKDNVQLIIKTDKVQKAQVQVGSIKNNLGFSQKDNAPILFENTIFDENMLPRFFKSVNCLISPTLGEGMGLPGLQCMALGVPIIITNFSGCQDYANDKTATLLEPQGFIMHQQMDEYPQFRQKKWSFITVSEIRTKMRQVLQNFDIAKEKAKYGAEFVKDNFNYSRCVEKINEMVETVEHV